MTKKILSSGAEAVLYKKYFSDTTNSRDCVIKKRVEKNYRIKELDESIRKFRTKRETKILNKLEGVVPVPKVYESTNKLDDKYDIMMNFIEGEKVSEILNEDNYKIIFTKLGNYISKIHSLGIVHGDLTTSNFIFQENKDEVFIIDFGLSFFSDKIEDKAVDIHLLRQSLESKHPDIWEKAFIHFLNQYKKHSNTSKEILNRFEKVEQRGRNKKK